MEKAFGTRRTVSPDGPMFLSRKKGYRKRERPAAFSMKRDLLLI
jgi:hypothetical protein